MDRNSNKLLILTYHRVVGEQDRNDPDEVDADQFRMHIDVFSKYFNVLNLSDAVKRLQNGGLPKRAISITFDDGYRDNVSAALPILTGRGMSATFFIATGFLDGGIMWNDVVIESVKRSTLRSLDLRDFKLGKFPVRSYEEKSSAISRLLNQLKYLPQRKRDELASAIAERLQTVLPMDLMMKTGDVIKLRDSGMEIGAHTRSHPILNIIADDDAENEILKGKRDLEQIVGGEVTSFAYPNGRPGQDYDLRHVEMVKKAGFRLAVTTAAGCISHASSVYQLGRMSVWHRSRAKLVIRMLLNYFSEGPATVKQESVSGSDAICR